MQKNKKCQLTLCKCGCGNIANHGDWTKGHWNMGKHSSQDTEFKKGMHASPKTEYKKGRISRNKGKTKETDAIVMKYSKSISETLKRRHKNGEIKNWNEGLTKETSEGVRKISDSKLGDKNPAKRPEVRKQITKTLIKKYAEHPEILENRKVCGLNQYSNVYSSEEKVIRDYLIKLNIHFQHNARIGKYWADFLIFDKTIIECDGEYWHPIGNEKDKKKDEYLQKRGYSVFRIRGDTPNKEQMINEFLKENKG